MKKIFALLGIFSILLLAGCPGESGEEGTWIDDSAPKAEETGTTEHFNVEEGTSTQISSGEHESGEELTPVAEYAEAANSNLFIYFITVGEDDVQGDAILIKKGDFDMLVDAGPIEQRNTVVNFLREKGVDDIEVLVSTHDDAEHSGGLAYVGGQFRIGEIWRPAEGSDAYSATLASIPNEGGIKYVEKGDERVFNGIRFIIENPEPVGSSFGDSDNDGIVLRLEDRTFCALLTGDIDGSAQTKILIDAEPCEVVQMPWHGMSEGMSHLDFFFDKLEPDTIIISGSKDDWTNSRQTIYNKAELHGIEIYENYDGAAAKVTYNGNDYAVTIEKD